MTDEVENLAVTPVPELEATAANPEPVVETPEVEAPKTFSQEELDAAIGKRLAREQRKWERDQAQRQAETQVLRAPVDDYSAEANPDAMVLQKAEEIIAKREAARQQSQVLESYQEREEAARDKYTDFEQVAYNPKLSITNVMAETIQSSDIGPELAYYLGSNPKDAHRIAGLSPLSQAKEIGKIEAKLAAEPPMKKTTSAPAPITPVTARSSGGPAFDTTDPRSTKTMTDSQWIEAERARQRKKWEAQNR
jgi:hypothetical protein